MDMEMKKNLATIIAIELQGAAFPAARETFVNRNADVLDWLDSHGFLTDPTAKTDASPKKECATCEWDRTGPHCGLLDNGKAKTSQKCVYPDRAQWTPKTEEEDRNKRAAEELRQYHKLGGTQLLPRREWETVRMHRIKAEIAELGDNQEIPREWTDEYNELLRRAKG
jgi:hypothetical protein